MKQSSNSLLPRVRNLHWSGAIALAAIAVSIQFSAAPITFTTVLAAAPQTNLSQLAAVSRPTVELPTGAPQCPNSGLGASCSGGVAAVPNQGSAPAAPPVVRVTEPGTVERRPSIPLISLAADRTVLGAGNTVELSASATMRVGGSPWVTEIFDQTTQTMVAVCAQENTCQVTLAAGVGSHNFVAYVAAPSSTSSVDAIRLQSTTLTVRWLGVTLTASDPSAVGPGRAVTFTATASDEVSSVGYRIALVDVTTGDRLTYCSQGTTCSTSLVDPVAGTHEIVADLTPIPLTFGSQPAQAKSAPVAVTWLAIDLTAGAYPLHGGKTALLATANADLANTPWAIFIYMSPGRLIDSTCVSATCAASLVLPEAGTPSFFAVVARRGSVAKAPGSQLRVLGQLQAGPVISDIQARSAIVTPVRMMWGVDSCAAFTQDAAGSTGLLPQVTAMLGAPDFWARYLPTTGNCAALSTTEIAAAHSRHMGILPIYNDYNCSAVSGSAAGSAYAAAAVQIAAADQIPLGIGIAIDIEPPGDACPGAANVDSSFITAWYDGISGAGYAPIYYGNTTPGSEFGQAWCSAVGLRPEIAVHSFLWTFEPDLLGGFAKSTAPPFAPNYAGCAGRYDAWQYRISDGSTPDVDHDEATNQLPLWYP